MSIIERYRKALTPLHDSEVNLDANERYDVWIKDRTIAHAQAFNQTKIYAYATERSTGMAYTEDTEENPEDVFRRAMENSRFLDSPPRRFNSNDKAVIPDFGKQASLPEMEVLGKSIEQRMHGIKPMPEIRIGTCTRTLNSINTHGLDLQTQTSWIEASLQVNENEFLYSASSIDGMNAEEIAESTAKQLKEESPARLSQASIQSGNYPVVLSSQVMRNIFMTAWLEFSAERMQLQGSLYREDESRVSSDKISLVNAASHPLVGQVWAADSEGSRIQKQRIIHNGLLNMPLYTLESLDSSLSKRPYAHAGCAGRAAQMTGNIPISLTTVPSVLYFEPGSQDRLELVKTMENGILLTYSLDLFHSVNIASGDFSIPCGGFLIRDGRKAGTLSQITMSGNIRNLLSEVHEIADDLNFSYFYFRNYCIGSPSMLLRSQYFSCKGV